MFNIPMVYVWLALAVVFFVVELATTSIVSVWFALGALAATVAAWVAPQAMWLQLVMFLAVSALTLYFTRPVLSKYIIKKTPTNADMLIGKQAVVVANVAPAVPGRVKVGDLTWQAKSDSDIPAGDMCTIVKIEGASLIVEKTETAVLV